MSEPAETAEVGAPSTEVGAAAVPPEIHVAAMPQARKAGAQATMALLGVASVVAALVWPAAALGWALSWAAVVGFFWAARAIGATPHAVSIGPAGLRASRPGREDFTPWAHVARLVDRGTALVAELHRGGTVEIDLSSRPDVRAILAIAPTDLPYVRADRLPGSAPSNARGVRTLLLWIVLVVTMIVVWRLVGR